MFCEIVEGVAPASILYSDESVVAFRDIREKARIQFLVVPRQHINDIRELGSGSKGLVEKMYRVGKKVLEELHEQEGGTVATLRAGYGFHRPPFTSVSHLHMHCFAKPRTMRGFIEYNCFWYISAEKLLSSL